MLSKNVINEVIKEWSWRVPNGMPDISKSEHLNILRELLIADFGASTYTVNNAIHKIANKNNPESYYILDSLAWAYFKKNNFIKASELMEEVINRAPGEAISLDHLGDIYFSIGRKREAQFMWIQALDLAEPEDNISESVQIKLDQYNAK